MRSSPARKSSRAGLLRLLSLRAAVCLDVDKFRSPTNITLGNDDWVGEEVHYDWQATDRFHVLAGRLKANFSLYVSARLYDRPDGTLLQSDKSFNTAGVFTECEFKITKWLTAVGGARSTRSGELGVNFSPRGRPDSAGADGLQDTVKAAVWPLRSEARTCTSSSTTFPDLTHCRSEPQARDLRYLRDGLRPSIQERVRHAHAGWVSLASLRRDG